VNDIGLSSQQIAVICALSSGATITSAAEQAGVHRNTILNWRRNLLPFQQGLADAQYDRALYFRERMEAEFDLAIQCLHQILSDPITPASVRLKAALAVIQTAAAPAPPKQQTVLEFKKVQLADPPAKSAPNPAQSNPSHPTSVEVHNPAQSEIHVHPRPFAAPNQLPLVHNPAQSPRTVPTKIGRNELCPCGSGKKYKRCCLDNSAGTAPLATAA
jgi:transposase-like protein